jgi:hypothetical protein
VTADDSDREFRRRLRHVEAAADDAGAEFERSAVVRCVTRCQKQAAVLDPSVTIRLASEPIDVRGLVRIEDEAGFGRWVRPHDPTWLSSPPPAA